MFSDLRANYDCITDGVATSPCGLTSTGATTQVVHLGGSGADGTDTLRNIERLKFADVLPPLAPKTVTAVAGDASATVTWTAPAGEVTGYTVEVTNTKTGAVSSLPRVDPAGTSLVATGLSNGTPYKFRVMATNTAGDGDFSAFSDVVTPQAFVPAPVAPVLTSQPDRPSRACRGLRRDDRDGDPVPGGDGDPQPGPAGRDGPPRRQYDDRRRRPRAGASGCRSRRRPAA